jgi:hypothetical protein
MLASKSIYFMDSFIEKKWIPALVALNDISHQIEDMKLPTTNYFHKLILNKHRLFPISVFLELEGSTADYQ